jgi:probable F420-dependent oxidoreductase
MPMTSPLEIGLSLRHTLQASSSALRTVAEAAEEHGLHSLWVPHHTVIPTDYASRYPYQADDRLPFPSDTVYGDALTVLSHLGGMTERLRLGTNVIPMYTQHPVALAKQAATVDALSGGRLELGIGTGWLAEEAEVLGVPTDHRAARLDEAIDLMRAAWTGEPFTHQGRFWTLPSLVVSPAAPQGPDLPIWIGGGSPAARRTIASRAVGSFLPPGAAGEQLLAEMRLALSPEKRLAIPMAVERDFDAEHVLAGCRRLHQAGVSLLVLYTSTEAAGARDTIVRFGEEILPRL